MMPTQSRWQCQAPRLLATHLAFDIFYLPGWILSGVVLSVVAVPRTNPSYIILLYVLTGLSLTSFSSLACSLFRRSQLCGISSVVTVIILAIAGQFGLVTNYRSTTASVFATGLLFPPMTYIYYLTSMAGFELNNLPMDLSVNSPANEYYDVTGTILLIFMVVQTLVFPFLGAVIGKGATH